VWIEYTVLLFMFLGGTSFLVHWHLLRRRARLVWRNSELRLWLAVLLLATVAIVAVDWNRIGSVGIHGHIRASLFQVVSIATTTGFSTTSLTGGGLSSLTLQIFLVLMLFGGCIGSTAGGLKIARGTLLGKALGRHIRRISRTPHEVVPLTLNGKRVDPAEIDRTVAIAIAWIGTVGIVWMVVSALSRLSGWESLSAALSALGNIGPTYVDPGRFAQLGVGVKVTYILAMIAGRLEILPFLLIFSRRVWR